MNSDSDFPPGADRDLHFKKENITAEQIGFFSPFSPLQHGEQLIPSFLLLLNLF